MLRCIAPVDLENVVLGQYIADEKGEHPAYTDDKTVPKGSRCATVCFSFCFYFYNFS